MPGAQTKQHRSSAGAADADVSIEDLPLLAFSRPADMTPIAERVLATARDPCARSYAAHALGVASREKGDIALAVRYLRNALAAAASCGAEREADVQASLGPTLAYAGRSGEALRHMNEALAKVSGLTAARVRLRRGALLQILGRTDEAIEDLRRAARTLRAAGDGVWEARALITLSNALVDRRDAAGAAEALSRAEALLSASNQSFEAAVARCNRGLVASVLGNVPEALAHYDTAEKMYADAGAYPLELAESRCSALLAAGLHADALRHGQQAVDIMRRQGASAAYLANALLRVGDAALAAGDPGRARACAVEAAQLFRRQGRERGEMLARVGAVRARYASGERSRRLLRDAEAAAAAADRHRVPEAVDGHVLAAEVALALGDVAAAEPHLARAARTRSRGSAVSRVLGWHACARRAQAAGRRRAVYDACERGLQVLDAYQITLGAVEMQAAATAHGSDLARIAASEALAADDPRMLLRWTERWRATTFAIPPVRPPDDDRLADGLATLRQLTRLLSEATADGRPTSGLERDRRRVEEQVRRDVLQTSGTADNARAEHAESDIDEVLAELGDSRLVEIVRFDGSLHVLVATSEEVRHFRGGPWDTAVREAEFSRFALRRLAYHRRPGPGRDAQRDSARAAGAALTALEASARRLQAHLLGEAADVLGAGPLVIAPPAALHPVPWGALPTLADRVVYVVPSALAWLRGHRIEPPRDHMVTIVSGPGLQGGQTEAAAIAGCYPAADVLTADRATTENVLASLEGRWLAHIAAHGIFRADNPLFSSLAMADGPLTVHDLQRLRRGPYRVVLTACDSGVTAPSGADEMLGLISVLGQLGTAGVLAPVVTVNDAANVPVTLGLHTGLACGATAAQALRDARQGLRGDPWAWAAAGAYVAFGAA